MNKTPLAAMNKTLPRGLVAASSHVICGNGTPGTLGQSQSREGCAARSRLGSAHETHARACLEIVISREVLLEEVSLVDVLVECKIVLLRHPLPAAPRRDRAEVEAAARFPAARLLELGEGLRDYCTAKLIIKRLSLSNYLRDFALAPSQCAGRDFARSALSHNATASEVQTRSRDDCTG